MTDKAKAFFGACAEGRLLEVQEALREASDAQTHTLLDQEVHFKPDGFPIELKLKPLHVAALGGHGEVVKLLVDKGANLHAQDENGWTALHLAARQGHGEVVKLLVDEGANLHAQDNWGWTALHLAARQGHGEVVKLLVDKGANLAAQDNDGDTALHTAAWFGHGEVVKLLLDGGANLHAQDENGRTALHMAALRGHGEVVKLLVDKGANLGAQDNDGRTALHMAAYRGHGEVVKLLLDKGANLDIQTNEGGTALHQAAVEGHGEVVKLLVDKGANLHAQTNAGWTALHKAAANGHGEVVKLLVDKGADLHAQDNDGRTVLHMALLTNSTEDGIIKVIDILVKRHTERSKETANGTQEVLVYDAVFQTHGNADHFLMLKTKLLDFSRQLDTSSINVLRLFAVLIDCTRTESFKFSDAEFSKLSKLVGDSLQETFQLDLFQKPLATLALLAGALGNRARFRAQVREDLISFRSKVLQLAFAALSIPEMDEQGMALKALGYADGSDIDTGAFILMNKLTNEGPFQNAPFVFLILQQVSELISVPQLQSSIDKVFYKARSTAFADFAFFEASVIGGDEYGEMIVNQKWANAKEYVAVQDCLGKPWKFLFQTQFGRQWKAQDWRTLPRYFFLSQFIFHCFYLILTVLAFWHADKASWSTSTLTVMTVGYAVEEFYQLRSGNGIGHYTDDPWNILDVAFIVSTFVWCATGSDACLALNLFLVPFRLLHYLSIFKASGVLVAVLIRMITATGRFLVFYAVILFGFAGMMFAFFGNQGVDGFGSFPMSCLTLFDASFGNYDFAIFDEMENYTWAGVALLTIFLLLSAVMAFNLLIAVLSEEYSKLADQAYIEWCFMYAQIAQESFVLESRFPDNLKLPPPFSVIFYVAQSFVWISQRLQLATLKEPSSDHGHDATVEVAVNPLNENAVPSRPAGLPHLDPEQHSQAPKGNLAAKLAVQLLPYMAILIVAFVDTAIHILVGLPWALFGLYFSGVKVMLGQAALPSYVLMLLSFGHLTNCREDDLKVIKEKYEGGFHKLDTTTKLLVVTGFMLWFLVGIPLVSLYLFIWSTPLATLKAYNTCNKEGTGPSSNTEAKSEVTQALLDRIREAISSCSVTDDGNEFAQVLGKVAKVESQVLGEVAKVESQVEAQVGELKAQVGELKAQVGELKAQGGKLEAMMVQLLEAQGLATPTPAKEESVTKEEDDGTGGLTSSAAPAGAEEKKSSDDR